MFSMPRRAVMGCSPEDEVTHGRWVIKEGGDIPP